MLLKVIDGGSVSQTILSRAQESVLDHSGLVAVTAVSQVVLPANAFRSGFFIQNLSQRPMFINELGNALAGPGSYQLAPGASFPPAGYPVSIGAVSVLGTATDGFTAREW